MSRIITVPFTEKFLPRVVDYVHDHYSHRQGDLSRLGVVFGGRRPSLFIKRDLAGRIRKPFVPPRFFTIDEWMAFTAYGGQTPSPGRDLDHCYTIYQLALELCPSVCRGRETFPQFLPWAREILRFIEQLDLEDVPLDSLQVIRQHAAIGFSVPQDINQLLMHLSALRGAFHEELERKGLCPRFFQYVQAAQRAGACDLSGFDEILFCNFFYLHRTENVVIKSIYDRGKAILFVQGDERRWPALSRIAGTFGVPVLEGPQVKPTAFDLKIYEASDSHAQAGLVKGILDTIEDHESTVIVLPDGDFLVPLLTAVGGDLKEFNISMGCRLKRSALYALLAKVMDAQKHRRENCYYTHDYLGLLRHPLVEGLDLGPSPSAVRAIVAAIEAALKGELLTEVSGRLFLDPEDVLRDEELLGAAAASLAQAGGTVGLEGIKRTIRAVHKVFLNGFENIQSAPQLAGGLHGFVAFMQKHSAMDRYPFNVQIASSLQAIADELKDCSFAGEIFGPGDLFKILEERLSGQMVAFSGSPLRGLQILGLFETRALNFKNVIVVDVNEGLLPNLNIYEPLIPREVMIKLNLDRLELEEEIQRYGFMRLISAAENVHLIYQHNSDRTRSRFLEELIWEQEQRASKAGCVEIIRGAFEVSVDKKQRVVPKTPAMVAFLKDFRFSATSINTYVRNPYLFYCRYVLGLGPKDDLLEDMESRHIGVFIHEILQEAFGRFAGRKPVVDEAFRKHFQKIYESRFASVFGRQKKSDTFLMETVLKTRLERFLDQEAQRCESGVARLLYVERAFEDEIELGAGKVRLGYRVDRVDEMTDGTILVLDYKTGSVESMPKDLGADFMLTRASIARRVRSFQMPLYVHYLQRAFPGRRVNSAVYHLRTLELEKFLPESLEIDIDRILGGYLKALDFIMAEIYNLETPFIDDPEDIK
ncbi:MAG: PD-(D/E)XK nuclease family protein [Candidatus Omnitrophica bacterium]|nr:PD-(D/E)XK nuclease family protein [Candidatus Omnitrophota bacterium]